MLKRAVDVCTCIHVSRYVTTGPVCESIFSENVMSQLHSKLPRKLKKRTLLLPTILPNIDQF